MSDAIYVSEIFYSIQGEGLRTGIPSLFLRLSGCNLACWFCDTTYASWKAESGRKYSVEDLYNELLSMMSLYSIRDLVVTGGEPTIQHRSLMEVLQNMKRIDPLIKITMETNGLHYVENLPIDYVCISPKLRSSIIPPAGDVPAGWKPMHGKIQKDTLNPDKRKSIRYWMFHSYIFRGTEYGSTPYLKFVVSSSNDLYDVKEYIECSLIRERFVCRTQKSMLLPDYRDNVFLVPEGATDKELDKHRKVVLDLCKKYGYRYCERVQLCIWKDGPRGV